MNTNININDVVAWLISSGFLLAAYFKVFSPMVHQWIATQNASKAKRVEELLITLADTAVRGLSVNLAATGADKKAEAVKRVNSALLDKGIDVDNQRIEDTVERSFQGFAQTNAPALANAQSAYAKQSAAAASQMAAVQSDTDSTADSVTASATAGLNPTLGATAPASTASPINLQATPESVATKNG